MTAAAWTNLTRALQTTTPSCEGDSRFTSDDTTDDDALRVMCISCPVLAECRAYATYTRQHRIAGYWAGRRRGGRETVTTC